MLSDSQLFLRVVDANQELEPFMYDGFVLGLYNNYFFATVITSNDILFKILLYHQFACFMLTQNATVAPHHRDDTLLGDPELSSSTVHYIMSFDVRRPRRCQDIHLAGLSGGAWTTSMVAAMDTWTLGFCWHRWNMLYLYLD